MIKKITTLLLFSFSLSCFSQEIVLTSFGTGFTKPVCIKHAGDSRLFVVEQDGIIKILTDSGTTLSTPFLNIDNLVGSNGNEQGLLGLAFHPNYATNGYFYVDYTNNAGDTVVARYQVSSNANIADVNSAQILMTISQPYTNHNGGNIAFGPDGYLYIGTGDGGSGGDPNNNAQNGNSMLGKMLRIDVDSASPYGIPNDNPFVNDANTLDEIWFVGLRNPWRFSFDKQNGDMWIGDVGQNAIEEIDHIPNGTSGLNFGWRCYEGNATYNTTNCSNASNYTFPVTQYNQGGNPYKCAITGGYVYRGTNFSNLNGLYLFADYCSGEIATYNPTTNTQDFFGSFNTSISTFGEDINGELYVAGLYDGVIYKIEDATVSVADEIASDISVHPNPTKGFVLLESHTYTIKKVEIVNLLGKKVTTIYSKNKIDLRSFENGIYFFKIYTDTKEILVKKIIKK